MSRSSTNDAGEIRNRYMNAVMYREIALELLKKYKSEAYQELLTRQIMECDYEIWKKNKQDSIIRKNNL